MIIGENTQIDGSLEIWTSATITSSGIVSANTFRDYNYSGGLALVSNTNKDIVESSVTSAQINYLNTTSANIQTQLSNLSATDSTTNIRFNSYLPLSGGTLTGNLSGTNIIITNPSATQVISATALVIQRPELSASTFATRQLPNTFANFVIQVDGKHNWGTSATSADTFLERANVNHLRTSGTFTAGDTIRVTGFDNTASLLEGGPSVEINYISASNYGRIISYDRTATSAKPFVVGSYDTTVLVGDFMTVSAAKFGPTTNIIYLPTSGTTISATNFYDSSFVGSRALVSSPSKEIIESTLIASSELDQLEGISANIQTQLTNLSGTAHIHSNKSTLDLINQDLNSSASPTFDKVFTTKDGAGQNIRIGNDAWIGDVNQANTLSIRGIPSSAVGYVRFGTDTNSFGYDGTKLNYNGSVNVGSFSATFITVGNVSNTEFQYLDGVSANIQNQLSALSGTKANSTVTITAGTMLSGGGDLSTNRTVSHQTVGTAGTYSNIVTNSTGHITSARALISADIPTLPATKIGTGIISDTEFNFLDNVSANIQTQLTNLSGSNNLINAVIKNPTAEQIITNQFLRLRTSSVGPAYVADVSGDTLGRFAINSDGKIEMGPGNATRDTNLYRGGADLLKSDDSLSVLNNIRVTNYLNTASNTDGGAAIEMHYLSATETGRILSYDRTTTTRKKIELNGSEIRNVVGITGGGELLISNTTSALHSVYIPLSGGNISATSFYDTSFVGGRVLISDTDKEIIESSILTSELSHLSNVSANIQSQLNQLSQQAVSGNGAGTPNRITKFVTSASMGDSSITDNGSLVTFTTQVSANNNITAPNFTGLASKATSALNADTLKTARSFSLSGEVTSTNVPTFNGSGNIVLSAVIANGINATKIADGSVTSTEFQYINTLSANAQTQLTNLSATAHTHANKSTLDLINQSLNTSASVIFNKIDISAAQLSAYTSVVPTRTISQTMASSDQWRIYGEGTAGDSGSMFIETGDNGDEPINISFRNSTTRNTAYTFLPTSLSANNVAAVFSSLSATSITIGNVSNTEFQTLDNVSANIQTQLTNLSGSKLDSNAAAGGDLLGNYPNPTVSKIQGIPTSLVTNGPIYYNGFTIAAQPNVSADSYTDNNFIGSRVLISNNKVVDESSITTGNLSFLSGVSFSISATQLIVDRSRIGRPLFTEEDNKALSARNGYGVNFGRTYQAVDSPNQTDYFSYIQMPESTSSDKQSIIAVSTTNANEMWFGSSVWSDPTTWRRVWHSNDFSNTNISNWNTSYTNTHTHSNKSTLDLINQSLNTSATISADKFHATNNGNGTNFRVGDDAWIGDINEENTMSIRGVQSAASGYIRFGSSTSGFGHNGSNLVYNGLFYNSNLSAGKIEVEKQSEGSFLNATPAKYIGQEMAINDNWKIYGEGSSDTGYMVFEVGDNLDDTFIWRTKNLLVGTNRMLLNNSNLTINTTVKVPGLSGVAIFDPSTTNLYTQINPTPAKQVLFSNNNTTYLAPILASDITVDGTGLGFGHPHDQFVNTTSNVTFKTVTVTGGTTTTAEYITLQSKLRIGSFDGSDGLMVIRPSNNGVSDVGIEFRSIVNVPNANVIKYSYSDDLFSITKPFKSLSANKYSVNNTQSIITTTATIANDISTITISAVSNIIRINLPSSPTPGQILYINVARCALVGGHRLYANNDTNVIKFRDINGNNSQANNTSDYITIGQGNHMVMYDNGLWYYQGLVYV